MAIDDPTDISDLELWLDADDGATITDSSGDVSAWDDKSANGFDFEQTTGGLQPRTGDATRNFLNVVSFASADVMNRVSGVICASHATIFQVFAKTGSANTFEASPITLASSGLGRPFDRWSNSTQSETIIDNTGAVGYTDLRTQTTWCILRSVVEKDAVSSGTHTVTEHKDGTQVDTDDITDTYSTTSQVAQLGGRNGGTTLFTGDIGEIIVYNKILTAQEISDVEDYLFGRWWPPEGSANVTLADATSTASGVTDVEGSANVTLADATSTASGSFVEDITGTANPTLADATSTASGSFVADITGTANVTLADATSTADGDYGSVTGSGSPTLADATSTASGTLGFIGSLSETLVDATSTGVGDYQDEAIRLPSIDASSEPDGGLVAVLVDAEIVAQTITLPSVDASSTPMGVLSVIADDSFPYRTYQ